MIQAKNAIINAMKWSEIASMMQAHCAQLVNAQVGIYIHLKLAEILGDGICVAETSSANEAELSSSSSFSPVLMIIGIIVIVVLLLAVIGVAVGITIWCKKRKQPNNSVEFNAIDGFY